LLPPFLVTALLLILLSLALGAVQVLAGGRELTLALPSYVILGFAGILSVFLWRRVAIPRATAECLITTSVFVAYIACRATFSPEEYLARKDLYLALAGMLAYLLVTICLPSSRARLGIVIILLVLAMANCSVGAIQFFKGQNFSALSILPRPDYGTRASGFFGYPNHLATFLNIAAMLGLAVTFWSRWPVAGKLISGYVTLTCLVGVLVTGSRGGYIACLVGLLVFGLLSLLLVGKLHSDRVMPLILAGALLIVGLGWGVQQFRQRSFLVQSRSSETLTIDRIRLQLWQAAWKQFKLQPAVGTGSGTYLYYGRQFRHPSVQKDPVYAHNEYIQLLAEYGILGIAALVMVIETHFRRSWNFLLSNLSGEWTSSATLHNTLALTVGAFSAAAAVLAHAFMEYNLHMPANLLVTACIFGLLTTPDSASGASVEEYQRQLPSWMLLLLPIFAVWLGMRALPTLPAEIYAEKARRTLADPNWMTTSAIPKAVESLALKAIGYDPRNPELYSLVGDAKMTVAWQTEDLTERSPLMAEALSAFEQALSLAPGDVQLVLAVGRAADQIRDFEKAESAFKLALKLDPLSSVVNFTYAMHLEARNKLPEALEYYTKSLRLGQGPAAQEAVDRLRAALVQPQPHARAD
jgi:O-antigen ligase